jgi:hypothetical protein
MPVLEIHSNRAANNYKQYDEDVEASGELVDKRGLLHADQQQAFYSTEKFNSIKTHLSN